MIPQQQTHALWFAWVSYVISKLPSADVILSRTALVCSIAASLTVAVPKILAWWRNRK